jgi:hypothetical protein
VAIASHFPTGVPVMAPKRMPLTDVAVELVGQVQGAQPSANVSSWAASPVAVASAHSGALAKP